MSKLVLPFSFANGMGGMPMDWFVANVNAIENFYNGMIDSSNIYLRQLDAAHVLNATLLDENFGDGVIVAAALTTTPGSLITYDKISAGAFSPAQLAPVNGQDNIKVLRTATDNTKQVRIIRGCHPASIQLNEDYTCYQTATIWSVSCVDGDPGFKEAPYLIFGQFVPDTADWDKATRPLTAVPFNISTVSCEWHISVAQGSSNLPDIAGVVSFTIYDLGGF
jgi:hypothetical protein